jgi:hypothetical protein
MPKKTPEISEKPQPDPRDKALAIADEVISSLSRIVQETTQVATQAYWQARNETRKGS